ncbi:hypothetical protein K8352_18130 [Flavobacteriaceae bacterium F89]|uniref:Zinc-finger domain-containing protein n=1 Tax=Cerina litoralis TaxID=2874477 RepID=A0AAE3EZM9_9FLAO|nr:hypothetical protein [Cerina litoralis]MCG2462686.1 hypothetical protein [Cerina litoralis]
MNIIMRRILGIVTFSCKRITEMVESKEVDKLSFRDRIRYNTHLALCKACRSYEKQSALIGKALSRMMFEPQEDQKKMDGTAKQKILEKIKES